jgi:hypothetical protein
VRAVSPGNNAFRAGVGGQEPHAWPDQPAWVGFVAAQHPVEDVADRSHGWVVQVVSRFIDVARGHVGDRVHIEGDADAMARLQGVFSLT